MDKKRAEHWSNPQITGNKPATCLRVTKPSAHTMGTALPNRVLLLANLAGVFQHE
jgi:hypothetical protein